MNDNITLKIEGISERYVLGDHKKILALNNVSLSVRQGEFVSIVGPSGCGKTTLIKLISGLIKPTKGRVLEDGVEIGSFVGNKGVVFQQYSLFPWLTVEGNIAFGLQTIGANRHEIDRIVSRYLKVIGLQKFAGAFPHELSGGMQQRVALARTLATNPRFLLMDEPFSALDVQTKRFMQDFLLQILQQEPRAVVFVTHDVDEAVFLSDTVYIMTGSPGAINKKVKIDLPRPRNLHVEFSRKFVSLKRKIQKIITAESLELVGLDLGIYKNM